MLALKSPVRGGRVGSRGIELTIGGDQIYHIFFHGPAYKVIERACVEDHRAEVLGVDRAAVCGGGLVDDHPALAGAAAVTARASGHPSTWWSSPGPAPIRSPIPMSSTSWPSPDVPSSEKVPVAASTSTVTAAVVGAAGAALYWWQHSRSQLPPSIVWGNGRIEADEIDIDTKFAGRILKLFADQGDMVRAGQAVALMDTRDLEAQQRQAESVVLQSQRAIEEAEKILAAEHEQLGRFLRGGAGGAAGHGHSKRHHRYRGCSPCIFGCRGLCAATHP